MCFAGRLQTISLQWSNDFISITADEALSDKVAEAKSKVDEAEEWSVDQLASGSKESEWLRAKAKKTDILGTRFGTPINA